jgi:rod shape-determining protein MreB
MMKFVRGWFANDLGVDLGTANTIIFADKQGIVLNEPSVVAIETVGAKKIIRDIGHGAKMMLGRTPGQINVVRPLKDGVIADFDIAKDMLNAFIRKVHGARWFTPGPRVMVCVPSSATEVERRAIQDSVRDAGATKVKLIDEPMAAAIGCELPVQEATGSMVVDIGGGTTEVGIISMGGLVYQNSIRTGGDKIDEAIVKYIREKNGIAIGEGTAEEIKKQIAVAHPEDEVREIRMSGQHVGEGVPRSFTINSGEMLEAMATPLREIVTAVRTALQNTPPELSADIAARGIMLTGGGALIRGLDALIEKETQGIPAKVGEDPLTCVARGVGAALQYLDGGE